LDTLNEDEDEDEKRREEKRKGKGMKDHWLQIVWPNQITDIPLLLPSCSDFPVYQPSTINHQPSTVVQSRVSNPVMSRVRSGFHRHDLWL
jgi:hypothetical protein